MHLTRTAWFLLLSPSYLVTAQIADIPTPPEVVRSHNQGVLSSDDKSRCEAACARIGTKFSARTSVSPSLSTYMWSGQQGDQIPACQVKPANSEEVVDIYSIVREERCHFAIKSGGHSRTVGDSNANGGVTIDLADMRTVDISTDKKSVTIGAGAQWVDIYRPLEAENLSVVGGRVADVGIGGLLTSGGLSYWTNRYGLGCDNVLSYEIVLPTGELATVDENRHSSLYRALRGGGASKFGIITSFELSTISVPNPAGLWLSFTLHPWSDLDKITPLYHDLLLSSTVNDLDAVYIQSAGYLAAHDAWMLVNINIHASHSDITTVPESYQPFTTANLTLLDKAHTLIAPYSNHTELLASFSPPTKRNIYMTFTYRPNKAWTPLMYAIFKEEAIKLKDIKGVQPTMGTQPLYSNALAQMSRRGGNALGLESEIASSKPLVIFLISWVWDDKSDDAFVYSVADRLMQRLEDKAKEMGIWIPWKYANYADGRQAQAVVEGYGSALGWLTETQAEYDPEGIYREGGLAGGFVKFGKVNKGGKKQAERKDEL